MTAKANAKCKVGDPVRWNSVGHFNRSMEDFLPLLARGEAVIVWMRTVRCAPAPPE